MLLHTRADNMRLQGGCLTQALFEVARSFCPCTHERSAPDRGTMAKPLSSGLAQWRIPVKGFLKRPVDCSLERTEPSAVVPRGCEQCRPACYLAAASHAVRHV